MTRPSHLDPRSIGLVVLGGTAGSGLRHAATAFAPTSTAGFPWSVFLVNLSGAFLLGLLLELLVRRVADPGRRRRLQLMLGTGLLGGYTTYSTFAWQTLTLGVGPALAGSAVPTADPLLAVGYAASTVALGFLAAWAGAAAAHALSDRRTA